jgi:hypothetical protein
VGILSKYEIAAAATSKPRQHGFSLTRNGAARIFFFNEGTPRNESWEPECKHDTDDSPHILFIIVGSFDEKTYKSRLSNNFLWNDT